MNNLVNLIREKGLECCLFKCDFSHAYRQLPVDPGDLHYLGYIWKVDLFIVDLTLTMDIRSVAYLCLRGTNALAHKAKKNGISVPKYLGDFVGVEVKGAAYTAFMKLQRIIIDSGAVEAIEWHASLGHRSFSWESWLIQIGWCWRMCWAGCGRYTSYCSVDWRKLQHKKAETNPAFMKLQKIIIESGAVEVI